MDRRSTDLVSARNDGPPPFTATFFLYPSSLPRSLLPSSRLILTLAGFARVRVIFVTVGRHFELLERAANAKHTRIASENLLFSHSKIFSLLSSSLSISGGDHPPLHARSFRLFTVV